MKTIDALRWDLATFEQVRVDNLELALWYWQDGLSHLTFLGTGNDAHIAEICDQVMDLMVKHDLIIQPSKTMDPCALNHLRGLLVYLVLNTAHDDFLCESQWSANVLHLCNQMPPIPLILTIAIAIKCCLNEPLEEFLACGPRRLTIKYFESFNEALSHISPDCLKILPLLSAALRAAGRAIVNYILPAENKRLLRQIACMEYRHILDSEQRLLTLPSRSTRKIYLAEAMKHLIEVLLYTLNDPLKREKPECFAVYSQITVDISDSNSNDPMPDLRHFARIQLDVLQRIFQLVSVDTFTYWHKMKSKTELYSCQELICRQTAELLKVLQSDEVLGQHPVCKQMQSFADAAKTLEQRVADMIIGELLAFLDSGIATHKELLAGLDNLFSRFIAFGNDECLKTMANHLNMLTKNHAQIILSFLGQVVESKMEVEDEGITEVNQADDEDETSSNDEYEELIRLVLRPLFMQLSVKDKMEVLLLRDEQNVTQGFNFKAPDHRERRIRFFNQLDYRNRFPISEFLALCFENAKQTWIDFSHLGVAHSCFSQLFWNIAQYCPKHTAFHISACAKNILVNEQLLQKPYALRFTVDLYGHRQILNGLHTSARQLCVSLKDGPCPYGEDELRQAQNRFLQACANALAKFIESMNMHSLQVILKLLQHICLGESNLIKRGTSELNALEKEHPKLENGDDAPEGKVAKHYTYLHASLPEWRLKHWKLISNVMKTIDALRWDLATFEQVRVDNLELALSYWQDGLSHLTFLGTEFRQRILNQVSKLKHKDFWIIYLEEDALKDTRSFLKLLTQSSAPEANELFTKILESSTDCAVMSDLSDAVVKVNSESAFLAFRFLFREYLIAFRSHAKHNKTTAKRQHWDHLVAVVAKAPLSIRNEIMELAIKAFAVRFDIDIQEQQTAKCLVVKEMPVEK
ncbi:GD16663 [Drosophila simulans]|uniref:GD16663 n=1 Tax=Drosophila simulans TaxID=7240 RepID=B4R486_DROSI|nr:GD16663 [Drosophila simulans]